MTTPFEQSARHWLREAAEGLDGRTRSRLNRARQAALAELPLRAGARRWLLSPAVAAVGAASIALALWWMPFGKPSSSPTPAVVTAIDDAELLPGAGEGLLDADPTLFALASAPDASPGSPR